MRARPTPGEWFYEEDPEGGWVVHTEHSVDHPDCFRDPVGAFVAPPVAHCHREADARLIVELHNRQELAEA